MNDALAAALGLGFLLGLRHALDPDHLAAISTIVSQQKSIVRSGLAGTYWGLGHTTSLLVVGFAVVVSQRAIPPRFAERLEMVVGAMLLYLGIKSLRRVFAGWRFHRHAHAHGGSEHAHFHLHMPGENAQAGQHHTRLRFALRPFLIGVVHGVAGSGALMLLVLTTLSTAARQLAYVASFGIGSIGGMVAVSALISVPVVFTAVRYESLNRYIQAGAGALSAALGCLLLWEHGLAFYL